VWRDFSKFYLIGLGGRGQTSLDMFGVWNDVEAACTAVVGRRDWAPGSDEPVERIFVGRKFKTQVLPRDKLVSVLYKHVVDNYSTQIELNYGYQVKPIDFGDDETGVATVEIVKCEGKSEENLSCDVGSTKRVSAGLVIAADGTARTVANEIEELDQKERRKMKPIQRFFAGKPFRVKRYEDDNQRIYKTIPIKLPPGWRPDLNYSARSPGGRVNIDALPANANGEYCGVLLLRKDDELAQPDSDPRKLREELDALLPMFSEIMDDDVVEQVAKKPPSFLPAFRFVGPRLHQGDHTIILGDCVSCGFVSCVGCEYRRCPLTLVFGPCMSLSFQAHTVKPYFGLGANSALEDVKILSNCIDETENMKAAVHEFSRRRARDSMKLVTISRELDRPGKLGAVTFIIPIILDAIFSKIAPKIFAPNIITMLQNDALTFQQVARRKRIDRALQLTLIGVGMTSVVTAARMVVTALAKAVGHKSSTITVTLFAACASLGVLKKTLDFLVPGMAPADILAKSKTKITDNESIDKVKTTQ
jgi:2-polyprenyl-6-methoxyphenol hydroxylase-like FAD-dependent oxidoreductase